MSAPRIVLLAAALLTPVIAFHAGSGANLWIANAVGFGIACACALYLLWQDGVIEKVFKPQGLDVSSGFLAAAGLYVVIVVVWTKFVAPSNVAGGLLQRCTATGPLLPRGDTHGINALWEFVRTQTCAGYGQSLALVGTPRAVAVIMVGAAEEIAWRGGVQRILWEKFGATRGWLATAALYGAANLATGNAMLGLLAATCGLVWGGLYRFRGRLVPSIFSHLVFGYFLFHARPLVAF